MSFRDQEKLLFEYVAAYGKLRESSYAKACKEAADRLGADPIGVGALWLPPENEEKTLTRQEQPPVVSAPKSGVELNKAGQPRKRRPPKHKYDYAQYMEMVLPLLPGFMADIARQLGIESHTGMQNALRRAQHEGLVRESKRPGENGAGRRVAVMSYWERVPQLEVREVPWIDSGNGAHAVDLEHARGVG
jgi:hypothetical protein